MKRIVGFSGGVDSQAAARWVINRYGTKDTILTNSNAGGNEHPLTDRFIDWYSENVHPVVRCNAILGDMWETPGFAETKGLDSNTPLDFGEMMRIKKRGPSRKAQFCTEILKLRPERRWIKQAFGVGGLYEGEDYCRYSGVRRDESEYRANTPFEVWDDWYDCQLFCPIADWTKEMCFAYVLGHGEQVNPLYSMGFKRVGCAPCINSCKEDVLNWSIRFPEMIDKIRDWEEKGRLASERGLSFFPPRVPGLALNKIDEVVDWAKTSRGGRQSQFPIMHERPACESKYGLCE